MTEREEDFTEDLDAFGAPRYVGTLKVAGQACRVLHLSALPLDTATKVLELERQPDLPVLERMWRQLQLMTEPAVPDGARTVRAPWATVLGRWLDRATAT